MGIVYKKQEIIKLQTSLTDILWNQDFTHLPGKMYTSIHHCSAGIQRSKTDSANMCIYVDSRESTSELYKSDIPRDVRNFVHFYPF